MKAATAFIPTAPAAGENPSTEAHTAPVSVLNRSAVKTFKMKTMGKIVMLLTALLFNTLTGAVCASVLGFSPAAGAVGMKDVYKRQRQVCRPQ